MVAFLLLLIGSILHSSCDTESQNTSPCNTLGGITITHQTGRVYQWKSSEPTFYYIGNEQPVSTGVNGGYIPCNGLPSEYKKEGLLVTYSGIDKGSRSDTGDPLFGYLDLKSIEVLN